MGATGSIPRGKISFSGKCLRSAAGASARAQGRPFPAKVRCAAGRQAVTEREKRNIMMIVVKFRT